MAITFNTVAAICGNFSIESTVNPGIYEGLNVIAPADMTDNTVYGGYGLGQWTNGVFDWGTLSRRTNLINYLDANNYAWDDGWGQLEFLLYEDYWVQNVGEYATLQDFLNNQESDINRLTYIWMRNWEGIYNSTISSRRRFARNVVSYLVQHFDDTNISTWVSMNNYLGTTDMKNNSVLICRYLMNEQRPKYKKKMPLWMYTRKV